MKIQLLKVKILNTTDIVCQPTRDEMCDERPFGGRQDLINFFSGICRTRQALPSTVGYHIDTASTSVAAPSSHQQPPSQEHARHFSGSSAFGTNTPWFSRNNDEQRPQLLPVPYPSGQCRPIAWPLSDIEYNGITNPFPPALASTWRSPSRPSQPNLNRFEISAESQSATNLRSKQKETEKPAINTGNSVVAQPTTTPRSEKMRTVGSFLPLDTSQVMSTRPRVDLLSNRRNQREHPQSTL